MTPTLHGKNQRVTDAPGDSCATFARLLTDHRTQAGYSIGALGRLSGLNHGYISKLEASKRMPSLGAIAKIAAALVLTERDTLRLALAAGHWPYHGELSDEAIEQILEAVSE